MAKKLSYSCKYAESVESTDNDELGGDIICKLTGLYYCPKLVQKFMFGDRGPRAEMQDCPGFNLPIDLAKKVVEFRANENKRRVDENKRSLLENLSSDEG